jgi:hypothetical protein
MRATLPIVPSWSGALLQQAPPLADDQCMVLVVSRQQKEITLSIKR